MWRKKATIQAGKEKRFDKTSTMVSTIKLSAYNCLKYVQIKKQKTLGDLRDNKSKPPNIYHCQDGKIWWNLHGSVLCLG